MDHVVSSLIREARYQQLNQCKNALSEGRRGGNLVYIQVQTNWLITNVLQWKLTPSIPKPSGLKRTLVYGLWWLCLWKKDTPKSIIHLIISLWKYGRSVRCTTLYRILTHPTNTPVFQGSSLWGVAFAPAHLWASSLFVEAARINRWDSSQQAALIWRNYGPWQSLK